MSESTVTAAKFREFVRVQKSGVCKMWDYEAIKQLTTLTRAEHAEIIREHIARGDPAYAERFADANDAGGE